MVEADRLIYSLAYYYPGLTIPILSNLLYILEKILFEEPQVNWTVEDGQASHPFVKNIVRNMIADGDLTVNSSFARFFGQSGIIARQSSENFTPYDPQSDFTERLRIVLKYLVRNSDEMKLGVKYYENNEPTQEEFTKLVMDKVLRRVHNAKLAS